MGILQTFSGKTLTVMNGTYSHEWIEKNYDNRRYCIIVDFEKRTTRRKDFAGVFHGKGKETVNIF